MEIFWLEVSVCVFPLLVCPGTVLPLLTLLSTTDIPHTYPEGKHQPGTNRRTPSSVTLRPYENHRQLHCLITHLPSHRESSHICDQTIISAAYSNLPGLPTALLCGLYCALSWSVSLVAGTTPQRPRFVPTAVWDRWWTQWQRGSFSSN